MTRTRTPPSPRGMKLVRNPSAATAVLAEPPPGCPGYPGALRWERTPNHPRHRGRAGEMSLPPPLLGCVNGGTAGNATFPTSRAGRSRWQRQFPAGLTGTAGSATFPAACPEAGAAALRSGAVRAASFPPAPSPAAASAF